MARTPSTGSVMYLDAEGRALRKIGVSLKRDEGVGAGRSGCCRAVELLRLVFCVSALGSASTAGSAPAAGTGFGAGLRFGLSDPEEPGVAQL